MAERFIPDAMSLDTATITCGFTHVESIINDTFKLLLMVPD